MFTANHEALLEEIKVLMVDDDYRYCEQIKTWFELKNSKISFEFETDPSKISIIIKHSFPDIFLLDYDMGAMDGLKVLNIINETYFGKICPKVIFLTNYPDKKQAVLEGGAFAFLRKSAITSPDDIYDVVLNACSFDLLRNWDETLPLPTHFLDPLLMSGLREVGLELYANQSVDVWRKHIACITIAIRSEHRVDRLALCSKRESRSFVIPEISQSLKREITTDPEVRFKPKWIDEPDDLNSMRMLFDAPEQDTIRTILAWPLETFGRDQIAGLWIMYGLAQDVPLATRTNIQMFFGRWSESLSQIVGELYLTQLERQVAANTLRRCAANMGSVVFGLASSVNNPPEVQWARQELIRQVDDMEATADAVLRNGSLLGDKPESRKSSFHQLVADILDDMRHWTGIHEIIIDALAWEEPLPPVQVRSENWRFVCRALVGNAVESFLYGDPDLLRDRPRRIQVRGCASGESFVLEVADTGLGLANESRRRVFREPFSTKDAQRGHDLMLVREIVREQGGEIVLVDTPPEGFTTVFRITLPNKDS